MGVILFGTFGPDYYCTTIATAVYLRSISVLERLDSLYAVVLREYGTCGSRAAQVVHSVGCFEHMALRGTNPLEARI